MSARAILSTLPYRLKQLKNDELYKIYVTNCLKIITENTGNAIKEGKYITTSYYDIINPPPPDTRTPESVISNIKLKISKLNS